MIGRIETRAERSDESQCVFFGIQCKQEWGWKTRGSVLRDGIKNIDEKRMPRLNISSVVAVGEVGDEHKFGVCIAKGGVGNNIGVC